MFPIDPADNELDKRGLILVQDPWLRSRILPLFAFDSDLPDARVLGQGTAFRIDPWSHCASAFHVIDDFLACDKEGTSLFPASSVFLIALEMNGSGYGAAPVPSSAWRPISGLHSVGAIEFPPLKPARIRNNTELLNLTIEPAQASGAGTPYLPVALRGRWPKVGERVMALGFADLDCPSEECKDEDRPISQYLFAGVGQIAEIEPADPGRFRMWPLIRVDANWPGGMSGGPVFNEAGLVIGLVSAGLDAHSDEDAAKGAATFFSGWPVPLTAFPTLDPSNPGRFVCWGAFNGTGQLVEWQPTLATIRQRAHELQLSDIGKISLDIANDEWMRMDAPPTAE